MTDEEFQRFRALIYAESGINLNDNKKALLVSRLSKRMRELGLQSFSHYYDYVTAESGGEEFVRMLDLISTNKTDFFREPKHFEFLRERIVPELAAIRRIRIWSAASSSGEEPYTIAMTLYDALEQPQQWDCRILASDISTRMLAKAATGIYEEERVQELPSELVRRHFLKGYGAATGKVKVKAHLSAMVQFRRINLMEARFPIKSPLDAIFCRNVMIYFDRPTQARLVKKLYQYLRPGGYLFIGHSESLQWIDHPFCYIAPTIYRRDA